MRKYRVLIISVLIVAVLAIAGTAVSFTLANRNSTNGIETSATGNSSLDHIFEAYKTQVQRIILNSQAGTEKDAEGLSVAEYRIVELVGKNVSAAEKTALQSYVESDEFRKKVIALYDGSEFSDSRTSDEIAKNPEMIADLIKVQVLNASSNVDADNNGIVDVIEAVSNADLVYINASTAYATTSNNDISADLYSKLQTYVLSDYKPIIVDSGLVGVSGASGGEAEATPPLAYTDLLKPLFDANSGLGVGAAVTPFYGAWATFYSFSDDGTWYIAYNNKTVDPLDTYTSLLTPDGKKDVKTVDANGADTDYADNYKFRILEIVPAGSDGETNTTDFENQINLAGGFMDAQHGFVRKTSNFEYVKVSSADFCNAASTTVNYTNFNEFDASTYTSTNHGFDIVFMSDTIGYTDGGSDLTADAMTALKNYTSITNVQKYLTRYQAYLTSYKAALEAAIDPATSAKMYPDEAAVVAKMGGDIPTLIGKARTELAAIATYNEESANRFIFDGSVIKKFGSSGTIVNGVDTSTRMYQFASNIMTTAAVAISNNVYVTSTDGFKTGIMSDSIAKKLRALINRSTYRGYMVNSSGNGSIFKVLEIQPYYPASDTTKYQSNGGAYSESLKKEQEVSISEGSVYYDFDLTKARIAQATGLHVDQISVTCVSTSAFNCMVDEVKASYDMLYVGGAKSVVKDKKDWTAYKLLSGTTYIPFDSNNLTKIIANGYNFNGDSDLTNTYIYPMFSHTGDFAKAMDLTSAGIVFTERDSSNNIINQYDKHAYSRFNGNDVTALKEKQLEDFVTAGMPVIIADEVISADGTISAGTNEIDLDSNMYKFLELAKTKSSDNVMIGFDNARSNMVDTAKNTYTMCDGTAAALVSELSAGTKVKVYSDDNNTKIKDLINKAASIRPLLSVTYSPINYDDTAPIDNDKDAVFRFVFDKTVNEGNTYTVKLFYDYDGDGSFTEATVDADGDGEADAIPSRIQGVSYTSELVKSMQYTVGTTAYGEFKGGDVTIPDEFFGVMPWKIEAVDNASQRKFSVVGYPKYPKTTEGKEDVSVLEILPGSGQMTNDSENGKTVDCMQVLTNGDVTKLCTTCAKLSKDKVFCDSYAKAGCKHVHTFGMKDTDGMNLADKDAFSDYNISLHILSTHMMDEMAISKTEDFCNNLEANKTKYSLTSQEVTNVTKFINTYMSGGKIGNTAYNNAVSKADKSPYELLPKALFQSWITEDFDSVIIGFAENFGSMSSTGNDMLPLTCKFIEGYVNYGGSLIQTLDNTSYANVCSDRGWARNMSYYLRDVFGMDRFKIDYQDASDAKVVDDKKTQINSYGHIGDSSTSTYSYATKGLRNYKFNGSNIYSWNNFVMRGSSNIMEVVYRPKGKEFFTKNSYDGSYEQKSDGDNSWVGPGGLTDVGLMDQSQSGSTSSIFKDVTVTGRGQTTQVLQNNQGIINSYPFKISSKPRIASTQSQYLALDLEDPDVQVWYSLAGDTASGSSSAYYAASQLDGRSDYYIFSKGNVTYTGAGFNQIDTADNNDDERKLILNAILRSVKVHSKLKVKIEASAAHSSDSDYHFVPATESSDAILYIDKKGEKNVHFDFEVTGSTKQTVDTAKVFVDMNENGVFDAGDYAIKDYTNIQKAVAQAIKDEKSKNTYFGTKNYFMVVVSASDDSSTASAKLKVIPESKLFDLN